MKKTILPIFGTKPMFHMVTLVLTAIVLVGLPACSSDMDAVIEEENSTELLQSEVVKTLQDYNNSLTTPKSRGIGWVGWLSVAIADGKGAYDGAKLGGRIGAFLGPKGAAAGAVVGGAVVGGAASYTQYKMAEKISNFSPYSTRPLPVIKQETIAASYVISKNDIKPLDYTLGLNNGLDSCSVKIAIQHNKILEKVDVIQFENNQQQIIENLDDMEKQIVNSKEFEAGYNKIVKNPLADNFDTNLTADKVMQLFVNAVSNSCQSQNDLNQIISHYTSVVKTSNELTSDEKEWLYAGFAVMGYSFQYWSEKWPYEE